MVLNLMFIQISFGQLNADSLLSQASQLALDGKYEEALPHIEVVLEDEPNRLDANIIAANVNAWNEDYIAAKYYIRIANKLDNTNQQMYDSWLNILLWNSEYQAVLDLAKVAENKGYENDYNLNLKKLYAYQNLDQYNRAIHQFKDKEVKKLLDSVPMQEAYDNMLLAKDRHTADSLLVKAQEEAIKGNYAAAVKKADSVFHIYPRSINALVMIAKSYAWQGVYDTAKIYLNLAYKNGPKNESLYDVWLNTLLWNQEYNEVIKKANLAEKNDYGNDYNLAQKRLYAYDALIEYDSAVSVFEPEEQKALLDSTPLFNAYRDILIKSKKHTITGYYAIDLFGNNDPKPQHLAYIDYGFKIKKNTLIFRLNYANRFGTDGLQVEVDYYHLLKKSKYFYFNYGISVMNEVFPKHRAGIEYFFPLKNKFEASVGARYMYFTDKHVPILTGHIGKYLNKYWFALRPYYTFDENSISLVANIRRFSDISFNYWGLELGYGNSPDERYLLDPTGDYFNLNSYRVKLEKSLMVTTTNDLKISFGFAYEETAKSVFRNRYTIEIIYKHRL